MVSWGRRLCCGLWCAALTVSAARAADDFVARYIASARKGYIARPCGFDMDRNGIVGEAPDRLVADGKTRDPDGDGVAEDILYVDADRGDDAAGDGSPGKPFKTIQKAVDAADGPGDGAEDIIAIAGTFHEALVLKHGGVPGHYVRDGFQFPRHPTMIVGWDRDGDGEYPPQDRDDVAVLDGERTLAWAITSPQKHSYIEIAHLTIRNYGYHERSGGAIQLFRWGTGRQSHVFIHDVEMQAINKAEKDASSKIVVNFWGGPMTDVAVVNVLVDEYSSYFCRGAPPDGAGRFRFRNITLRMFGVRGGSVVTGWKLWGHHRGVEIRDCVLDCNADAWRPRNYVSGIGVCQGTQQWTIRGNVLIDLPVILQPYAKGYPFKHTLDRITIDRNVFRNRYRGWDWPRPGIKLSGSPDAPAHQSIENVTITNNFFSTLAQWGGAIHCSASNGGGPQRGTVTIAGNTFAGPVAPGRGAIAIDTRRRGAFRHESFVLRNNIVATEGPGLALLVGYAPKQLVADGNLYGPRAKFLWRSYQPRAAVAFDAWQRATGQDARSATGTPAFLDAAGGDLHLAPHGAAPAGPGVDITDITRTDFDGQPRSADRPVAGADVPARY